VYSNNSFGINIEDIYYKKKHSSNKMQNKISSNALIVDNDSGNINLLQQILNEEGWQTYIATDKAEAINIIQTNPLDMVFLDLMLPVTDGFDVCKTIRYCSQVPMIVMSGPNERNDGIRCLQIGADDYLTKPFEKNELLARMHAVIRLVEGVKV
jgi:DNA-binding response OmpR family regulator